jgi:uncharacterized protein YgiB involved in biofilm formation
MKRSRSIRLVLLGSAGLLVASCDEAPDPLAGNDFFQNEQQCAAANDASACHQALVDAQREHAQTAPAYASRQACEDRFGIDSCTETRNRPTTDQDQPGEYQGQPGGSWFMPAMLGYMMGRSMAAPTYMTPPPGQLGRDDEQQQATGSSGGSSTSGGRYYSRPVFRDIDNTVYSGKETLGQTRAFSPPRATSTAVRGGFGRTGSTSVAS